MKLQSASDHPQDSATATTTRCSADKTSSSPSTATPPSSTDSPTAGPTTTCTCAATTKKEPSRPPSTCGSRTNSTATTSSAMSSIGCRTRRHRRLPQTEHGRQTRRTHPLHQHPRQGPPRNPQLDLECNAARTRGGIVSTSRSGKRIRGLDLTAIVGSVVLLVAVIVGAAVASRRARSTRPNRIRLLGHWSHPRQPTGTSKEGQHT